MFNKLPAPTSLTANASPAQWASLLGSIDPAVLSALAQSTTSETSPSVPAVAPPPAFDLASALKSLDPSILASLSDMNKVSISASATQSIILPQPESDFKNKIIKMDLGFTNTEINRSVVYVFLQLFYIHV